MLRWLSRLVVLARPRGALLVCALPLLGFGYALWERGSDVSPLVVAPALGHVALVWLLGHAGAMWLNAELDRDEGAVLLGRATPVPRGTAAMGYLALALSVACAVPLGALVLGCVVLCALLSVLYSHPRVALKGHPIAGPLVNGLGYATLSPVAGWAVAHGVPTWRAAMTLAALVSGVLGLYFAAQAFQGDEDRARGYRTLVVTHGPRRTLEVARACLGLATLVVLGGAAVGIYPRALLVALVPCALLDRWMARWSREPAHGPGDARMGKGMVRRIAAALACVVLGAYAHHFTQMARGAPLGGLGTAIVPTELGAPRPSSGAAPTPRRS